MVHGEDSDPNVSGEITFMGSDPIELETDEKARLGMLVDSKLTQQVYLVC